MKTVIDLAREAGFEARRGWWVRDQVPEDVFAASVNITREIESFAALVRADEREQCLHAAEVAASLLNDPIAAIRERSNT